MMDIAYTKNVKNKLRMDDSEDALVVGEQIIDEVVEAAKEHWILEGNNHPTCITVGNRKTGKEYDFVVVIHDNKYWVITKEEADNIMEGEDDKELF